MRSKAPIAEKTSREKLIHSAEHLFAERGFDGVSVRDIATDAKVNSALVGYYFGGKEGLLAEVYARHCEPLKLERARLLHAFDADGNASLEQILEAFIVPSLEAGDQSQDGRNFSRLRAILSAENSLLLERLVSRTFDATSSTFVDALCKCLPHLSREDVFWRFHFLLGAIYYTAIGPRRIRILSKGKCDPSEPKPTARELIRFAAAGFRSHGNGSASNGKPPRKRAVKPVRRRKTTATHH